MTKYLGLIDRILRILLLLLVSFFIIFKVLTGFPAFVLEAIAGILLLTSFLNFKEKKE